jgi:NAD(P)-dependent dehydrogenase (short-subunit alcohol dehydrogenase family)
MSSGTANWGRIDFDDLQREHRYRPQLAYAQSKLTDLMLTQQLAAIAATRDWKLMSTAAHPGYTRTNLQTAGASLGRGRPSRVHALMNRIDFLPSQGVEQGAEPLLYAATRPRRSPAATTDRADGSGSSAPRRSCTRPAGR